MTGRRPTRNQPSASISSLTDTFAAIVQDTNRSGVLQIPPEDNEQLPHLTNFQPVTVQHVSDILKSLNLCKSPGPDNVLPSILKNGGDAIAECLTDIVNESLQTGNVPTVFKQAIISPLRKSGDPDLAANYHPVSLLPICAKVLERIVLDQIMNTYQTLNLHTVATTLAKTAWL